MILVRLFLYRAAGPESFTEDSPDMKKIFAWLLLLAMVFSMTACGDTVPASVSDTAELQEVPAVQEEAPAEEAKP